MYTFFAHDISLYKFCKIFDAMIIANISLADIRPKLKARSV